MKNLKFLNFKTVRFKFLIPVITFTTILIISFNVYRINVDTNQRITDLREKVITIAQLGSQIIIDPIWNVNDAGIKTSAEALLNDKEIGYIEILDTSNKELYKKTKDGNMYQDGYWIIVEKDILRGTNKVGTMKIGITKMFVNENVKKDMLITLGTVFVMIIFLSLIIGVIATIVTKPIKKLKVAAKELASGNLNYAIDINSSDELGELASEFNITFKTLREMISKVVASAETTAAFSEELQASAETNINISKEMTLTSKAIAQDTEEQSQNLYGAQEAIKKLGKSIANVSDNLNSVSNLSNNSKNLSDAGMKAVKDTIEIMKEVSNSVETSTEIIQGLSHLSEKIMMFVDVISSISQQTNLLSLNASIEAARAGEHGKGFAVVANEVKKLAEQSSHSATQIISVVTEIKKSIEGAVSTMDKGSKVVIKGTEASSLAGQALAEIVEATSTVANIITQVDKETDIEKEKSNEIVLNINKVVQLSEQTAAGAEEYSAGIDSQVRSFEEIANASAQLSSLAENLIVLVNQFKI